MRHRTEFSIVVTLNQYRRTKLAYPQRCKRNTSLNVTNRMAIVVSVLIILEQHPQLQELCEKLEKLDEILQVSCASKSRFMVRLPGVPKKYWTKKTVLQRSKHQ